MIKKQLTYYILILSFVSLFFHAQAQNTAQELEAKRKQLEKEIEYTNQMIVQTRKSKQVTVNELKLLNSRISKRNELLATLKKEVSNLDTEIDLNAITPKFYRILKQLGPFGPGNMTPVFMSCNLRDTGYAKCVGEDAAEPPLPCRQRERERALRRRTERYKFSHIRDCAVNPPRGSVARRRPKPVRWS